MNQQINLYQPIFRKQKVVFSALAMAQVWGIIALMMAGITGYTAWRLSSVENQLAEMTRYRALTEKNLKEIEAQSLARTPSGLLEAEVLRTEAELGERRQIADLMNSGALSNTRGFSAQFEGLARQHAAGSWLTEITLREGGHWVNLRGMALAPEVVPAYLQNLLAVEAFQGIKFNVVNLQVAVDDPGRLWFEVGTAAKETALGSPATGATAQANVINGARNSEVVGITRRPN